MYTGENFPWEIICKLLRKAIKHFHQMDHVCVGRVVIQKFFGPNCSFSILLIDVWFDMHTHTRGGYAEIVVQKQ